MSVKTASKTRTLVILAMLCAMAFILTAVGRIPVVLFLKYDPKDIVIAIGGFLFGPLAALSVSVVTSIVEMLTLSDTGVIGLVMNILSSASFACVARIHSTHVAMTNAAAQTIAIWFFFCIPLGALGAIMCARVNPETTGLYKSSVAAAFKKPFTRLNGKNAGTRSAATCARSTCM